MTHMCCCRISEILKLKRRDIDFRLGTVYVAPMKKGPAVVKHILKPAMMKLRALRDRGASKQRSRCMGMWGVQSFKDCWRFPKDSNAYLFPSLRAHAGSPRITKDTVCRAISRLRQSFDPPKNVQAFPKQAVRSHSGRHRMVNDMKRCEVPDLTAMHFARIVDRGTYLGYGQLDDLQAGSQLAKNKKLNQALSQLYQTKKKRNVR